MKHVVKRILGFALLGALVGVGIYPLTGQRDSMSYGLSYSVANACPVLGVLALHVAIGLFLGGLTGLSSAFFSGHFVAAYRLLGITIPALLTMAAFPQPHSKAEMAKTPGGTPGVAGAAVAFAVAVVLAYLGYRRTRGTAPTPPAR